MNWEQLQRRVESLIQVDVMASADAEFMATHAPMRNLRLETSGFNGDTSSIVSEEEIYQQLVINPSNEHRMVLVFGPPGMGKSHLIRWLHARANADHNIDSDREKLVFIRRAENTLRGTLAQLVDQGVVPDELSERLKSFLAHRDVQSPEKIVSQIYFGFLTALEHDPGEGLGLSKYNRQALAFLSDPHVKDHLCRPEGPIWRFYRLLSEPHGAYDNQSTQFTLEDFTDFGPLWTDIKRDGSHEAQVFATYLDGKPKVTQALVRSLNSYAAAVVQGVTNLVPGDINEMVFELRRSLKREGKNLTFFIEDLTTFTGIDSELVKVLSIQHGGAYDDLCRVSSFIGITDWYYANQFRDNQRDRVTQRISVGKPNFTSDFAQEISARYVNAAYLTHGEIEDWYRQGANPEQIPYKAYTPNVSWDSVRIGDRDFTLFPLNRRAIDYVLEQSPSERTQEQWPTVRLFLRDFLKAQLRALFLQQSGDGLFPDTSASSLGKVLPPFNPEHEQLFDRNVTGLSKSVRDALRALFVIWGDGQLYAEDDSTVGGIPVELMNLLGFPKFSGIVPSSGHLKVSTASEPIVSELRPGVVGRSVNVRPIDDVQATAQKRLQKTLAQLESWYRDGVPLEPHQDLRESMVAFLGWAVAWQMEGVPNEFVRRKLLTRYVHIEGQAGGFEGEPVFLVKRDAHAFAVLQALAYWYHNGKKWNFSGASYMQYRLLLWLENNKSELVSAFRGDSWITPNHLFQVRLAGLFTVHSLNGTVLERNRADFLDQLLSPVEDGSDTWTGTWEVLRQYAVSKLSQDPKDVLGQINTQLGSGGGSTVWFVARDFLEDAVTALDDMKWNPRELIPGNPGAIPFYGKELEAIKAVVEQMPHAVDEQIGEIRQMTDVISNYIGDPTRSESWDGIGKATKDFMDRLSQLYINHELPYAHAEVLIKRADELAKLIEEIQTTDETYFNDVLTVVAKHPQSILVPHLRFLNDVMTVAKQQEKVACENLKALQQQVVDGPDANEVRTRIMTVLEQLQEAIG